MTFYEKPARKTYSEVVDWILYQLNENDYHGMYYLFGLYATPLECKVVDELVANGTLEERGINNYLVPPTYRLTPNPL